MPSTTNTIYVRTFAILLALALVLNISVSLCYCYNLYLSQWAAALPDFSADLRANIMCLDITSTSNQGIIATISTTSAVLAYFYCPGFTSVIVGILTSYIAIPRDIASARAAPGADIAGLARLEKTMVGVIMAVLLVCSACVAYYVVILAMIGPLVVRIYNFFLGPMVREILVGSRILCALVMGYGKYILGIVGCDRN
jgi:hypothetical protein